VVSDDEAPATADHTVLVATTATSTRPPDARATRAETLSGRWQIIDVLGTGGMGTVYRARDRELDETVALKMVKRETLGPDALERFRREVKLARRVSHRNVARVFELGEHEGERFFTMELIEGESLRSLLDRVGPMPMNRLIEIGVAIARGLDAAHQVGVVHRDLKPDNVLVGLDGRIAITDFGIAASLEQSGAAETTSFAGTPMYMAPEQVDRQSPITAKSDVYALGAVLYELGTGEAPFKGETPLAIAVARLTQLAPDPRKLRPSLSDSFAELVLGCMAQKPEERVASAALVEAGLLSLDPGAVPAPRISQKPAAEASQTITVSSASSLHATSAPGSLSPWSARSAPATRLAVVPLVNLGADDDAYVADGLTDDLIDALSTLRPLRVLSRGLAERWAGRRDLDPREVGQAIGATVLVTGSLRRLPDRTLQITLRLLSTEDGSQVWTKRFAVPDANLLEVNQQAAGAIAGALALEGYRMEHRVTDPVAVELYLRARAAYREFSTTGAERANTLYGQALAIVPNDPVLLSGKAMSLARIGFFHGSTLEDAREMAQRALALAPHAGDAHLAMGTVHLQFGNLRDAMAEALLAISHSPSLGEAHQLAGRILAETGPADAALRALGLAIEIEPRMGLSHASRAQVLANIGRWEEAYATMEEARPTMDGQLTYHIAQARLAYWNQDQARIDASIQWLAQISTDGDARADVAKQFTMLIDPVRAPGLIDDPEPMIALGALRRRLFVLQAFTEIAVNLGRLERALGFLERAVHEGLTDLLWLDGCPMLAPLRLDPRWFSLRAPVLARAEEVRALLPRTNR
jgi:eukaryotic-like serine/threonine-protein kinase